MSTNRDAPIVSRRRALALGGVFAGSLIASAQLAPAAAQSNGSGTNDADRDHDGRLPVKEIEDILQAKGSIVDGVLRVGIDRTDIDDVKIHGIPILPSFEVNGTLAFQPLAGGQAFFNGDIALKPGEINRVIDAIVSSGLVFQAQHQHMYDFDPMVWFIHFRGQGNPLSLARSAHTVLKATSTPLPQQPPAHPETPFDADRLKQILHGVDVEIGDNGVVTVLVARRNPIRIGSVAVEPATNIETNIGFQPLTSNGSKAAVVPDFGLEANEIDKVMRVMRGMDWDIGCLYNQETDEHPQLFFSHQFKTGDPYALAHEIRTGLDQTNSQ